MGVRGWEFIVKTGAAGATGFGVPTRELVTPLTIMADTEGARENVDPEIVTGEEPGARVWLPMM